MSDKIISPLKAIKAFCLDCCGDNRNKVANCLSSKCPLFEFRFGKNPHKENLLTCPFCKHLYNKNTSTHKTINFLGEKLIVSVCPNCGRKTPV